MFWATYFISYSEIYINNSGWITNLSTSDLSHPILSNCLAQKEKPQILKKSVVFFIINTLPAMT
jgi:hypothetical protein